MNDVSDVTDDNVIHVRFGPGGGRRIEPERPDSGVPGPGVPDPGVPDPGVPDSGVPEPSLPDAVDAAERRSPASVPPANGRPGGEPYGELFRRREVARLFDVPEGRLKYWAQSGFLEPSGRVGRRRYYTFQDLISIRAAKELLDGGAPLPTVRRSLANLRETLPHVTRPLNELRVSAEGQSVVVHDHDRAFDAATGQLRLDFEVRDIRDDVVRVLRPRRVAPERRQAAYERYLEGCRLDEDESTHERAEACYREAIALDPGLANALTNLGNLRFRRGDVEEAERLYRRALEVDEEQPEAFYNLGFLAFDRGEMLEAATLFARAVEHDPGFADAHFNLAMALEELGRPDDARGHWSAYLELDPEGPWAEIARKHLSGAWR
ncbi:MAG TPA: tetratricopeptide repeat protein [Sandaracinaceae bacterium LLY-WYZ-13_1]|nr:tetratricopeptide repeat protein [Sandaracinaceae bacterium LLY-WYZ-13_1]